MTLILTVATANKVVQVSDRRLTMLDGRLYDDEANKAVCVVCKDAKFSMAYTGLAFLGKQRRRTDLWLVDWFNSTHSAQLDISSLVKKLAGDLSVALSATPTEGIHKGIIMVLAGFRLKEPFIWPISNIEDEHGKILDKPEKDFKGKLWKIKSGVKLRRANTLFIHGTESAVNMDVERRIKKLRNRRFFQNEEDEVSRELVSLIRMAAHDNRFGKYISRNCMSA